MKKKNRFKESLRLNNNKNTQKEVNLKEIQLEIERDSFLQILQQLPVAVIICEAPSGKLIFTNNKVNEVLGPPASSSGALSEYGEWRGFHSDGSSYKPMEWPLARSIKSGAVVTNEQVFILRDDNTPVTLLLNSAPIKNAEGKIVAGVLICEDFTEKKRAEVAIASEQAALESSRLKSEFLAIMSHELRTPLNGIIGLCQILAKENLTQKQSEFVKNITKSSVILKSLVNDILDLSRIEAGKVTLQKLEFNLPDLVQEVKSIIAPSLSDRKLTFSVLIDSNALGNLKGDSNRVRQILLNLVSNAVKFTLQGGIKLEILFLEATSPNLAKFKFSIQDTGIGISEEGRSNLFEKFYRVETEVTKNCEGTGLGLAICKKQIDLLGGEIGFESELGKGSCFWFTLSFEVGSKPNLSKEPAPIQPRHHPKKAYRILVAEDNVINQTIFVELLEQAGYQVQVTNNGKEALKALNSMPFDAILMDCQMPEMDGLEATQVIRKHETPSIRNLPIIAVTAKASMIDREMCFRAGMNEYIDKPLNHELLLDIIERVIVHKEQEIERHIDLERLEKVRGFQQEGKPDILKTIVNLFLDTVPERITQIRAASQNNDLPSIEKLAHSLRGSAGAVGAVLMTDICLQLENLKSLDTLDVRRSFIQSLDEEFTCVKAVLQKYS